MTPTDKVKIRKLPTGVPGLDEILGGGLPEFSFNIIAGAPGCGKTTLAHQFVFANATPERPALYFTIMGEPALKMLRYQQQYTFFDSAKLSTAVRFFNLSQVLTDQGLTGILQEITREIEAANPGFVVVDSFRTAMRRAQGNEMEIQVFLQQLGLLLASWEATTFLLGEYMESELRDNPVFTVADGLIWLHQTVERNAILRKLQVMKLRGQMSVPGLHTFRITDAGVQAFSRTFGLSRDRRGPFTGQRLSVGIPQLDEMLDGGIPEGDSLMIVGSAGTGKSLFATHFIAAGLRAGEVGVMVVFEERPEEYVRRAASLGLPELEPALRDGRLVVASLRPLDLSVDEAMTEILDAVRNSGTRRVTIDSLAGLEIALTPGFREDFREALYRMMVALTGLGVTVVSTIDSEESFTGLSSSRHATAFLADDVIRLRYVEIDGELRRVLTVLKMRQGAHSRAIREYEITSQGLVVGERLTGYEGLLTGVGAKVRHSPLPENK